MKKVFLILIASVMATFVSAQDLTPQEEREFYQKAYSVINEYAQSAKVDDDRNVTRFMDLFESKDLQIFNDLMSLSYEPTLSVAEYVRLLHEADMVNVVVKNVQKLGDIADEETVWQLSVTVDKRISFVSKCNTLFDSFEFYGYDYRLLMTLSLDKSTRNCYISSIEADGAIEAFPRDYRVLMKVDERDNFLDINGSYVKFVMDQKLLRPEEKLSYRGAKVGERDLEGQCDHKVFADYSDKLWRIRLNGAFALSGFNKLGDAPSDISTSENGETAFGLDFGYVFPSTSHLRIGLFAGVGLSMNSLTTVQAPGVFYSNSEKTQDIDGENYKRIYNVDAPGIKQEMKATDIFIPVYADFEYEFNSILSAYADLGLKLQTSSGKMTVDVNSYTTSGEYSDYGDLIIENVKELGFGNRSGNNVEVDEGAATKSMAIDGLLGLGVRLNVNKSFAVDAGLQYQIGGKSWKPDNRNEIFSYTQDIDGEDAKDYVNLLPKTSGISHSALKLGVSLIYKF